MVQAGGGLTRGPGGAAVLSSVRFAEWRCQGGWCGINPASGWC